MLDAPNLPERPTFPKRPLFAAGGLGGGLAVGLGIVFLLEFMKKSIRNEKDVTFYLQMATLVTIPDLDEESSKQDGGRSKGPTEAPQEPRDRGSLRTYV